MQQWCQKIWSRSCQVEKTIRDLCRGINTSHLHSYNWDYLLLHSSTVDTGGQTIPWWWMVNEGTKIYRPRRCPLQNFLPQLWFYLKITIDNFLPQLWFYLKITIKNQLWKMAFNFDFIYICMYIWYWTLDTEFIQCNFSWLPLRWKRWSCCRIQTK